MELFLLSRRTVFALSGRDCRRVFGWRGCRGGGLRFFRARLSLLLSSSSSLLPPFFSWGRLGSCSFLDVRLLCRTTSFDERDKH